MEDVLIKIAADAKEFVSGLAEVEEKSNDLGESLQGIGVAAGVAFAGFSASIMGAVYAYRQQEQASIQVNQEILATGGIAGVTAGAVNDLAEALSAQTTFSRTAVTEGEAVLLTFTNIGKEVFPEATQATLDLAAGMHTDLSSAASLVGRALQDPIQGMTRLQRAGIQLTEVQKAQIQTMVLQGNTAGAQGVILKALEGRYGGMAQAAAGGTGVFLQVKNAMEDLTQAIGADLAPMLISGAHWLKEMIDSAAHNQGLVDFIAQAVVLAAKLTGATAVATGVIFAFQKVVAVFELATTVVEALGVATGVAVSATGLGAILVVGGLIYAYWDKIWPAMQGIYTAFVQNISALAKGLGTMLLGAMMLDTDKISLGWAEVKLAVQRSIQTIGQSIQAGTARNQASEVKQTETHHADMLARNRAYQQQLLNDQRNLNSLKAQAQKASAQAEIMQLQGASAAAVALKKQEAQLYTMLTNQQFAGSFDIIRQKLAQVQAAETEAAANEIRLADANRGLELLKEQQASSTLVKLKEQEIAQLTKLSQTYDKQQQKELEAQIRTTEQLFARQYQKETQQRTQFINQELKANKTFQKMSKTDQELYIRQHEQNLATQYQTEDTAQEVFLTNQLNRETQAHNQFLQDQIQFGTTYAELNEKMHSTIFQGSKTAFGELEQLTQSHSAALKTIGKAAATANIIMKTYESAMNIFAGFSTIPIIGYALGIAGAAAAVAFGVEQLGQVQGMAQGGLVSGGVRGMDSVPIMAQQGELVVPQQNFNDVVSSFAKSQGWGPNGGQAQGQAQQVQVQIDIHPNARRILQVGNIKDQAMGTYRGNK